LKRLADYPGEDEEAVPIAGITLESVHKVFPNGVVGVDGVDLEISEGEFMVLVGPSGCGKTSLLRMVSGLEEVTAGRILIGDRDVTDLAPRKRDVAMVFQTYALYPHMTVRQNLGYGLKVRRTSKSEIKQRVEEVARLLGLEDMLSRRPAELSGGQRQRVAMGRAIVREPKAFLMDEPLSNLDAKLRVGMRASLSQLHSRLGVTTLYVTHDQVEAMTLGQRVAVMRDGRILQVDAPQRLYEEPRDLFVAAFIGSPAMNLVEATIVGNEVVFGQLRLPLDPARRPSLSSGGRVVLGIRPEAFGDGRIDSDASPRLDVVVEVVEELGSDAHVFFQVDAPPITSETLEATDDQASLLADEKALFNARIPPGTIISVGESLPLTVDPRRFHFFDASTGESLLTSPRPAQQPEAEQATPRRPGEVVLSSGQTPGQTA
jgi:multiple sugar transport system ATP-binding protein